MTWMDRAIRSLLKGTPIDASCRIEGPFVADKVTRYWCSAVGKHGVLRVERGKALHVCVYLSDLQHVTVLEDLASESPDYCFDLTLGGEPLMTPDSDTIIRLAGCLAITPPADYARIVEGEYVIVPTIKVKKLDT